MCFALANAQESKPAGDSAAEGQILLTPDALKWGPMPKGVPHFGVTKGDVVQISGTGPLKVRWAEAHTQDTSK